MTNPNWPGRPVLKITIMGWRATFLCWLKNHIWKDVPEVGVQSPTDEYVPGQYCTRCLSTR